MGVIFDTKAYTAKLSKEQRAKVDAFFDSLNLEATNDPLVPLVPFADFMSVIDPSERWAYKGSLTTPPCTTFVYFNVLSKVYPISEKHLELFRRQIARGSHNMDKTGNWRVI
jgi:carbonic anhydrase